MKRFFLVITLLIFAFSCNKSDDTMVTDPVDPVQQGSDDTDGDAGEPNDQGLSRSVSLDAFPNLDLTGAEVLDPNGSTEIDAAGTFEESYVTEEVEELPIIITKGEELLFGYFPDRISSNQITSIDFLNFFLLMHPEIAIRGYDLDDVIRYVSSSSDRETLITQINSALNENASPLSNEDFIKLLNAVAYKFIDEVSTASEESKDYLATLKINYSRDGQIGLPLTAPIFSSMGIQVINTSSGEPLISDHILKPGNFALDLESQVERIKEWIKILNDNPTPQYTDVTLQDDGVYKLLLTNGKRNDDETISKIVRTDNEEYFISLIWAYTFPRAIKKIISKDDCFKEIVEASVNISENFVEWLASPPAKSDIWELVQTTGINSVDPIAECAVLNFNKYLEGIALFISKYFSPLDEVHNASLMMFFYRDFFLSNIAIEETRYFQGGISYGELEYKDLTDTQITGEQESSFKYEGRVKETEISYGVERPLTGSTFTLEELEVNAEGIPFSVNQLPPGDATLNLNNSSIESNEEGIVQLTGKIGSTTTEVEIIPGVPNTGIQNRQLRLIPEDSDGDSVSDDNDLCPNTPAGETVDSDGCADSQKDSDGDTIPDNVDECPNTPSGDEVTPNGCTDNWDPNDESTWRFRRDLIMRTVSVYSVIERGYSRTFSLQPNGEVIAGGCPSATGYSGSWSYNGRTFTVSWSCRYERETTDENGDPITEPAGFDLSFSGTLEPYLRQFTGTASESSVASPDSNYSGPARANF